MTAALIQQLRRVQSECDALAAMVQELVSQREEAAEPEPEPKKEETTGYYSIDDLTQLLGISEATVYRWVRVKRFPQGRLLGLRTRRWDKQEVEQWRRTKMF